MAALAKRTIENRHSDMGPADPNAPPLQPAHGLSRTRSLFTAEPTNAANGLNCWWQYDELTGASWGEILEKHAEGGDHLPVRDVIGLSPMSIEVVRRRAAAWWRAFELGIETRVEPQRETLPTPAPRFLVEDVKRYQPKTFERPTTGKVTHSIRINGHTYTLQTGSRAQTKRMISNGTYSGPGRVTPLPGGGPEAFASRVPAGTKGLEWLRRSETATPIFTPTPMTENPHGTPVSTALTVASQSPRIQRHVTAALDVIDSVHGDGNLPNITVSSMADPTYNGWLKVSPDGTPLSMAVNKAANEPMLTTAHEVGHFLDHGGIPDPTPGAFRDFQADPRFAGFNSAVSNSDALKALQAIQGQATAKVAITGGATIDYPLDQAHIAYLLQDNETWARAYAQYIATESEHPQMLDELANARDSQHGRVYNTQWSEADFTPIAKEITAILTGLGWIK